MASVISQDRRLLVDRMELRWIVAQRVVIRVGRVARAVNCGLIDTELVTLTEEEIGIAAAFVHRYDEKPYAGSLTHTTAAVPLLAYRTSEGDLVLLDGRQRAVRALALQTGRATAPTVECRVVSQHDAFRVGQPLSETETRKLLDLINDPEAAATFGDLLASLRSADAFTPVSDHLRAELRRRATDDISTPGAGLIAKAVDTLSRLAREQEPYKLLQATRRRPVVFEGEERPAQSFHTVLALSVALSHRRPAYDQRQKRVVNFYRYMSLELATLEEILARRGDVPPSGGANGIVMDVSGIERRGASEREERCRAYDAYLRAHWNAAGLGGPNTAPGLDPALGVLARSKAGQYPVFATTYQNAARILRDAGFPGDLAEFTNALTAETGKIAAAAGVEGLAKRRDGAVAHFRLFAKAIVRMNQWEPARKALLDIEGRGGGRPPSLAAIETAARWDLDRKPSLVGLKEMVEFSLMCGVVATDIWPIFLTFDSLLQCCALIHDLTHNDRVAERRYDASAIEAYVHRIRISENDEADHLSDWWARIRSEFEQAGVKAVDMERLLRRLDEERQIDDFALAVPAEDQGSDSA